MEGVRSCLARIGCLTLLVLGVGAGWRYHDDVSAWWKARAAGPAVARGGEELAARTHERLDRLLRGRRAGVVRLDADEVSSYLRHRISPGLPAGIADPRVRLRDSTAVVEAAVDLDRLAGDRLPEGVRRLLGDSTRISASLLPGVPAPGRLRLRVRELRTGVLRVPSVMLPRVLRETGLPVSPEDPTALEVPLGFGLTDVRVEKGTLVLVRSAGSR